MKFHLLPLALLALAMPVMAQAADQVTLRFISFPRSVSPQPVELLIGEGETLEVRTPTNALSQPYQVRRLNSWSVGKVEEVENAGGKTVFTSYGSAASLASSTQLILLIRNGRENADGIRVVPLDYDTGKFGGGKFFFMNASKVDIAGLLGGTQFALKPGAHTIIEAKETFQREGQSGRGGIFTEFFFRKDTEARPFFSSTWPANNKARSMVFFYHDIHNDRLRMHTIRDYLP